MFSSLAFAFLETIMTLGFADTSLQEMVSEIAMKWTKAARTGATEAKFTGVDVSTIMLTMQKGRYILEVRFVLFSYLCGYEKSSVENLYICF